MRKPAPKPTRYAPPPPPPPPPSFAPAPLGMSPGEAQAGTAILNAYDTLGRGLSLTPPFQGAQLPPLMYDMRPDNALTPTGNALKPIGTPGQVAAYNTPRGLTQMQNAGNRTADTLGANVSPMMATSSLADGPPPVPNLPSRTYSYRNMPAPPAVSPLAPRDTRGDARGGLWSLLAGGLLGGLLGGGSGALAGGAAAGQGYLQGADAAEQQRQQQYQQAQQFAMHQNALQRQGVGDFNAGIDRQRELDTQSDNDALKNYSLQYGAYKDRHGEDMRRDELTRREQADIVTARDKFINDYMQLDPEGQKNFTRFMNPAELDRLQIPYTKNPDGSISLPQLTRAPRPMDPLTSMNMLSLMDDRQRGQLRQEWSKAEDVLKSGTLAPAGMAAAVNTANQYRSALGLPLYPPDYRPREMTAFQEASVDIRKEANRLRDEANDIRRNTAKQQGSSGKEFDTNKALNEIAMIANRKAVRQSQIAQLAIPKKDASGNPLPISSEAQEAIYQGRQTISALEEREQWLRGELSRRGYGGPSGTGQNGGVGGAGGPMTLPGVPGVSGLGATPGSSGMMGTSNGLLSPGSSLLGGPVAPVTVQSPIGPITAMRPVGRPSSVPSPKPSPTPKPLAVPSAPAPPRHHSEMQPRNDAGQFNGPPKAPKSKQTPRSMGGNPKKANKPLSAMSDAELKAAIARKFGGG